MCLAKIGVPRRAYLSGAAPSSNQRADKNKVLVPQRVTTFTLEEAQNPLDRPEKRDKGFFHWFAGTDGIDVCCSYHEKPLDTLTSSACGTSHQSVLLGENSLCKRPRL